MVLLTCKLKNRSELFDGIHRQEPIKKLRATIASKFQIPVDETSYEKLVVYSYCRIMYGGKFLEDGKTLWDYKVNHGSTLLIMQRKVNHTPSEDTQKSTLSNSSSQPEPSVPQFNVKASEPSYSQRRYTCKLDDVDESEEGVPHTIERRFKTLFKIDLSLLDKNEETPMEIDSKPSEPSAEKKKTDDAQEDEQLGGLGGHFVLNFSEDEFFVEAILAERRKKGKLEYLVKWKGYTEDWNTWEPAANVAETEALEKFLQTQAVQTGAINNNTKQQKNNEEKKESTSNYKIIFDFGRLDLPTDKESLQRYALIQLTSVENDKQQFLSVTTETNPVMEGTHSIVFQIDPTETPFPTQIVYLSLAMLKDADYSCVKCNENTDLEKMLVCDTCGVTYHIYCLDPPLEAVPKETWYCSTCFAKPQEKKKGSKKPAPSELAKSNWGGGMACVGRTKNCTIVGADVRNCAVEKSDISQHIGKIPGIDVGTWWKNRIHCSEDGVHRPPVAGIAGNNKVGAPSIVVSGGYEDDDDKGEVFIYTGAGGRDLTGNKRTAAQSCDQELTRVNYALAAMCYGKKLSCKECNPLVQCENCLKNWKKGKPVRVVRSSKKEKRITKHHVPDGGYRYDGLYKVVDFWPEIGQSGFVVYRYLLKRDDDEPAPWTAEGKEKAERLHKEGLKRANPGSTTTEDKEPEEKKSAVAEAPKTPTKRKTTDDSKQGTSPPGKKMKQMTLFGFGTPKKDDSKEKEQEKAKTEKPKEKENTKTTTNEKVSLLTEEQRSLIAKDKPNAGNWDKILKEIDEKSLKNTKDLLNAIDEKFQCCVCLDRCTDPVTNPCGHNFCLTCAKHGMEKNGIGKMIKQELTFTENKCPLCRAEMPPIPKVNQALVAILRSLFGN